MPPPEKISEAFSAFDKDGDGLISSSEFITLLRSVGVNLKQQEVITIEKGQAQYTREACVKEVEKWTNSRNVEKDLMTQLKNFDRKNKGTLNVLELKQVMKNMSEMMSEQDLDDLSVQLDPEDTGEVKLQSLIDYMTT